MKKYLFISFLFFFACKPAPMAQVQTDDSRSTSKDSGVIAKEVKFEGKVWKKEWSEAALAQLNDDGRFEQIAQSSRAGLSTICRNWSKMSASKKKEAVLNTLIANAYVESHFNPSTVYRSDYDSFGLFQLPKGSCVLAESQLLNPFKNIQCAINLFTIGNNANAPQYAKKPDMLRQFDKGLFVHAYQKAQTKIMETSRKLVKCE